MCIRDHVYQCIIPPHMLEQIVAHGTPEQRDHAVQNVVAAERFRTQRRVMAEFAATPAPSALISPEKQRIVYSAQNRTNLPGVPVRSEGQPPTGDPAVDEAYDGAGVTYDLFNAIYGRNSIDDRGMRIESTVHYGVGYDNAFWNGQRMVYGDGDEDLPQDQRLFNRFTIAVDIIGHELTHGVTQYEAGLIYRNQPGALNESMSDVFGILVKQRALGQTAVESDWVIGGGLFTPNVNGAGIRSMKAPGTAYNDPILGRDPQPGHMRDYNNTLEDNGGVHINSGIPNRAFYVTAVELGGFAWEKAGRIWYVTLRDKLRSASNFAEAADLTWQTAGELYGRGSLEQQAVRTGWAEVGILISEGGDGGDNGGDDDGYQGPSGCLPTLLTRAWVRYVLGR